MNDAKKEMLGKRLGRALAETDFRNKYNLTGSKAVDVLTVIKASLTRRGNGESGI